MKYICKKCGFIYDEIATKVKFATLPDNYVCKECGAAKKEFKKDTSNAIWVEKSNPSLCFLEDKCTNCGLCKKTCENVVGIKVYPKNIFIMEENDQFDVIDRTKDMYHTFDFEF